MHIEWEYRLTFLSCSFSGGASKGGGEEPGKLPEPAEEESQVLRGTGHCKWFNVRMGFGFISMINREGSPLDIPVDVFVHQVSQAFFSPLFIFFHVEELISSYANRRTRRCPSVYWKTKFSLKLLGSAVFRVRVWAFSWVFCQKRKENIWNFTIYVQVNVISISPCFILQRTSVHVASGIIYTIYSVACIWWMGRKMKKHDHFTVEKTKWNSLLWKEMYRLPYFRHL